MAVWNDCASQYTDKIEAVIRNCSPAVDDKVVCLRGDIDKGKHAGNTGRVEGFARFSMYHPREVRVKFEDGQAAWFWLNDVTLI